MYAFIPVETLNGTTVHINIEQITKVEHDWDESHIISLSDNSSIFVSQEEWEKLWEKLCRWC